MKHNFLSAKVRDLNLESFGGYTFNGGGDSSGSSEVEDAANEPEDDTEEPSDDEGCPTLPDYADTGD